MSYDVHAEAVVEKHSVCYMVRIAVVCCQTSRSQLITRMRNIVVKGDATVKCHDSHNMPLFSEVRR